MVDLYLWWQVVRLAFAFTASWALQVLSLVLPTSWLVSSLHQDSKDVQYVKSCPKRSQWCMDASDAIKEQGFKCQEHHILTNDGFVLVSFRIPGSGPPVFLMHGLCQSCDSFLVGKNSLAFALAREGYDVWLGNARGNKYSCKHKKFKPNELEYWDHSIDEMASYDIPAVCEYILKHNSWQKLAYIGFSQGSAMGFASFSTHHDIASKVSVFIALSPAAKIHGIKSELLKTLTRNCPDLVFLLFGKGNVMPWVLFFREILPMKFYKDALEGAVQFLFGWSMENVAEEEKYELYSNIYSHASAKSVVHWFQIMRSRRFAMFDDYREWSFLPSKVTDNGHRPPAYPLESISCPIALLYGHQDLGLLDINSLIKSLPQKNLQIHPFETYEHLDFIYAKDAHKSVHPKVFQILSESFGQTQGNMFN